MREHGLSIIPINKITSFSAIISQLDKLRTELKYSELNILNPFNEAYIVITKNIYTQHQKKLFYNPKFIEEFTIEFSKYYFQVINAYLEDKTIVPVWSNIINARKKNIPNFMFLLMGANAHINHDLAKAMIKVFDSREVDNILPDVLLVDKVIKKSTPQILNAFEEQKVLPKLIKKYGKFIYLYPVIYMILLWRVNAWKKYLKNSKSNIPKNEFNTYGTKLNKTFIRVGRLMSI